VRVCVSDRWWGHGFGLIAPSLHITATHPPSTTPFCYGVFAFFFFNLIREHSAYSLDCFFVFSLFAGFRLQFTGEVLQEEKSVSNWLSVCWNGILNHLPVCNFLLMELVIGAKFLFYFVTSWSYGGKLFVETAGCMAASVIFIEFCIHFMVSKYGKLSWTNFWSYFFEMEALLFLFYPF
jgi:hypothetical protein